jgi:Tol biopolymer transport system component
MQGQLKNQNLLVGIVLSSMFLVSCHSMKTKPSPLSMADFVNLPQDPQVITGMKQITFEGTKSGEGYFSADGKKMIFQSDRYPGNPFYQIYLMNFENGNIDLVSTGRGKTTCAWIHPSGKKVIFSSTHLDPDFDKKVQQELEARKTNQKNHYAWSFDDTFQIFEKDLATGKLKQLTHERGYNAEGDYSPDGKSIVFTSNRSGYSEKLSAEDAKLFAQDPSVMADIYVMKSDGTHVKRLTTERGYDGGPFFSSDGKKIVWRRFSPLGQIAEVYTMNADGSGQKPVTHLKAMSWAPFFHPSGDYIVFTSNLMGYQNFELFIVDSEGKHAPVRVTYTEGFDGLPVFSPDGKQISWTRKNEKGESQIYLAQWDDAKARALLGLK